LGRKGWLFKIFRGFEKGSNKEIFRVLERHSNEG
jgi:hypothetical protein